MSEHIWKFGDWGREKSSRLIARFVTKDPMAQHSVWVFSDGSIGYNRQCEYLPDCTGFDWKPIEPPNGYRILSDNEVISQGDIYHFKGGWLPTYDVHRRVGDRTNKLSAYARKIEPKPIEPPKGYRLLADDESLQDGDMYVIQDQWFPACGDGRVTGCTYARKIKPTYRPFANAEEFKPHRDRWWKYKGGISVNPPASYTATHHDNRTWRQRFADIEFEDGSPFGVENK